MNSGPFLLCKDNIKILFTLQFLVLWIHYFSKKNHIRRILLQALQNFIFWLFCTCNILFIAVYLPLVHSKSINFNTQEKNGKQSEIHSSF